MSIPPYHYFSNNILFDFPSSGKKYKYSIGCYFYFRYYDNDTFYKGCYHIYKL